MNARLLIIGAGGHAKVLVEALRAMGAFPRGLLERDAARLGDTVLGCPVLGTDEALAAFDPAGVALVNGLGSTRDVSTRAAVFERFRARGYRFFTVVHPAAVLAESVVLGQGAQVMAGAVVQPDAVLGDDVLLNTGATLDHDSQVGDHVHIAPGVTVCGGVRIGARSHLGSGATVIEGVTIGQDCLIGAGAVVLNDVPDGAKAFGVPARWKL